MQNVVEVRPKELECDVVRFQNNKEKWVAFVGLLDGYPYEIFTGLQDDEEGIALPKTVTKGKIIKQIEPDGKRRYDFQFENKRGYKTTVEGLSEKFNPEYWNYAKLISGVLRYRMPIDHVIKLVSSLQLKDESINTWKNGVERALKKRAKCVRYVATKHLSIKKDVSSAKTAEHRAADSFHRRVWHPCHTHAAPLSADRVVVQRNLQTISQRGTTRSSNNKAAWYNAIFKQ